MKLFQNSDHTQQGTIIAYHTLQQLITCFSAYKLSLLHFTSTNSPQKKPSSLQINLTKTTFL